MNINNVKEWYEGLLMLIHNSNTENFFHHFKFSSTQRNIYTCGDIFFKDWNNGLLSSMSNVVWFKQPHSICRIYLFVTDIVCNRAV